MSGDQEDPALRELLAASDDHAPDERVAAALAIASTWVGDDVSLVGVGATDDGTPCLVVHTRHPVGIPAEVGGVPVRVVRDGDVRAGDA